MTSAPPHRLVAVDLDEVSLGGNSPDRDHERRVAIRDLLAANEFRVPGHAGPYALKLALHNNRLAFDIRTPEGSPIVTHLLSLKPLRGLLKDYLMLCEHHGAALRNATPAQIETIDMGRRGLHNDGAEHLAVRLKGKVEADFETMRRLFTLMTALHWKG